MLIDSSIESSINSIMTDSICTMMIIDETSTKFAAETKVSTTATKKTKLVMRTSMRIAATE